jgi:hypothetical protein
MNTSADHFDEPPDSPNYALLRDTAWMGGEQVEGRYLLSWATGVNEFRRSNEEFKADYRGHVKKTWPDARKLLRGSYWQRFFLVLLRQQYRESETGRLFPIPHEKPEDTALRTLLINPALKPPELANVLQTAEKQLLHMPELQLAYRELA